MPLIQSEENMRDDNSAGYYGRLPSGYMCSHSAEMTRDETFTLARLQQFSPCDYESYRARGEEYRHRLSGAVLQALNLSDVWNADWESGGEWGGVFPVHVRMTHRKCKHVTIDILSPGEESPFWHGLIWLEPDHTGLYFWNSECLAREVIGELLQGIDNMVRSGYAPGEIAGVLRRGGVN